jgi:hypothetical protein
MKIVCRFNICVANVGETSILLFWELIIRKKIWQIMKNTFGNKLAAAKSFHAVILIVRKGKNNYVANYSINHNTGVFV